MIGKENIRQTVVGNLHNANLPINLSAEESNWEGFVKILLSKESKQRLIIRFQQIIVES